MAGFSAEGMTWRKPGVGRAEFLSGGSGGILLPRTFRSSAGSSSLKL